MDLLVIGGTRFLGRHVAQAALARGDRVTLFNRGRAGPAPAGAVALVGDRRGDLSALAGGRWDAVVDTCGYLPAEVARMADTLSGRVGRYCFVSTVSVYAASTEPNTETSALGTIDDPATEVIDGRTYGPLKALCEAEVLRRFGARAVLVRPGLIVGPHDPTQRFTWWPARLARAAAGEAVLAPGRPGDAVQFIDARDLAAFMLAALDQGADGAFNATSPAGQWTFGDLLQACATAAGVRPRWAWRPVAALQAQGIEPWTDLPLALPDDEEHRHFHHVDTRRAQAAGLRCRPLADTVADTLAWWRALPADQQGFDKAGLSPEREAAALAALPEP